MQEKSLESTDIFKIFRESIPPYPPSGPEYTFPYSKKRIFQQQKTLACLMIVLNIWNDFLSY